MGRENVCMEGSEDKRLMAWTAGAVWWERAAANDFKLAGNHSGGDE